MCLHQYFFLFVGKDITLIPKKTSLKPDWNCCFDTRLYEGRAVQIMLKQQPDCDVGQVVVSAQSLADQCKDGEIASIWVGLQFQC